MACLQSYQCSRQAGYMATMHALFRQQEVTPYGVANMALHAGRHAHLAEGRERS